MDALNSRLPIIVNKPQHPVGKVLQVYSAYLEPELNPNT